jgi:hypothetical protein
MSKLKKPYSECQNKSQAECITLANCFYTNGTTRKFCRKKKNSRLKEKSPTKEEKFKKTRKISVKERVIKLKKKDREAKDREAKDREAKDREAKDREAKDREAKDREAKDREAKDREENEEKKREAARGVIQRFMNKTKHRRKAVFLKAVCLDSGLCLAFGAYNNEIKKHFGGFANFEYVIAPIKRIGSPSENGFITEIQYDHSDYKAFAVLKSAMKAGSDNLMYEYIVGQYVNKLNKRFPCFLETYSYYIYNTAMKVKAKSVWNYLKDSKITANMDTLKKGLVLQKTTDYAKACKNSKYLAILIQHLKGITSIKDMMSNPNFVTYELANMLFQIYMPLSMVADTFTHYDLHNENVNLYEPKKDSYIHFHYHVGGNTIVSFKSKYIAKIIDYGRSYFIDEESGMNSKKIYAELCKETKCKPACGYDKGFGWLAYHPDLSTSYWINSQKRNASHDLRLLSDLKRNITRNNTEHYLSAGLKSILQTLKYDTMYGTPEMTQGYPNRIQNVYDVIVTLGDILSLPAHIQANDDNYRGKTKLGDLHIYCEKDDDRRPMRFVKA